MFWSNKILFAILFGIVLMVLGLILFYVRQKFSVYDRAITEQSQLLKHLVNSIHNNSISARGASDEARRVHEQFSRDNSTRIIVSDDEDDNDDNDNDDNESTNSSSETEDDTESSTEEEEDDNTSDNEENELNKPRIVVSKINDDKINIKQINLLNVEENEHKLNLDDLSDELAFEQNDQVIENVSSDNLKIVSVNLNEDDNKSNIISSNNDYLENMSMEKKYIDLSKQQLQDLCKDRNLSTKGSKKDLIDRLLE